MRGAPRTLLLTDRYLPEVGGSIVWFSNVYRRYPPGTVWIVTKKNPGADEVDRRFLGIRTLRLGLRRYRFLRPESLMMLAKLLVAAVWTIRRYSIQIVHAGKLHPEGLVARIAARVTHIPYVVYAHGEELTVVVNNPNYAPWLGRLRSVYNDSAAVIANSDYTRAELLRFGIEAEKIVRISPGVDSALFKPGIACAEIAARYSLEGKMVLVSIGRLQKRKGHDHVLRALPKVLKRIPHLAYLIVSSGEEEEFLKSLSKELGLEKVVRFVGEVPFESLSEYYNTADIFIMANRTLPNGDVEGFGIVFLEANACGKPVIAGDSGGTADPVLTDGTA